MAKNRIIYALFLVICVAFSIAYRSNFSAILMITVLAYLPLAAVFTAVSLFFAKVDFSNDVYIEQKEQKFNIEIKIQNRFVFPLIPIEMLCFIPDANKGLFCERRIFTTLQPFGQTTLAVNCRHKYRGRYKAEIRKIYVVDPLRIIRFSKSGNRNTQMVFLPRRFMLEDINTHSSGNTTVSKTISKSSEKEDFSHVRDYRDGDLMQYVHWKLTAKSDEIMIKEYESINERKARVICDFKSCQDKKDVLLFTDTIIETSLAITRAFVNEDILTRVDYGDTDINGSLIVRNPTDFELLYETMAEISPSPESLGIDVLSEDLRVGEQSIIVIITADLSENTVRAANLAAVCGAVVVAYVNLEKLPLERSYREDSFYLMNILDAGKSALKKSAEALVDRS